MRAIAFIQSMDLYSFVYFFWFTLLFEIPRYAVGAIIVPIHLLWRKSWTPEKDIHLSLSIVLAGYNEEKALRPCIESLAEQTVAKRPGGIEVIVIDDGSTDRMSAVAFELQREGKIDRVFKLQERGGKGAAINLGLSAASGDIIVISDIDTSYDRDAFAQMLRCFDDPTVGAVAGDLGVRNASASLITRYQAMEYALSISLGRCISEMFGTLTIVSGAFGAFRRVALDAVGQQDVEMAEDGDLTLKLRRAGWRIRFAPEAHALTEVPETIPAFISQRLRWDRSLITVWVRKYRGAIDPRNANFRLKDVLAYLDIILFEVQLGFWFIGYVVWLFYYVGEFAFVVLLAMLIGDSFLNLLALGAAAAVGIRSPLNLLIYLPLLTVYQVILLRVIRIVSVVQELILRRDFSNPYQPPRVWKQVERE